MGVEPGCLSGIAIRHTYSLTKLSSPIGTKNYGQHIFKSIGADPTCSYVVLFASYGSPGRGNERIINAFYGSVGRLGAGGKHYAFIVKELELR